MCGHPSSIPSLASSHCLASPGASRRVPADPGGRASGCLDKEFWDLGYPGCVIQEWGRWEPDQLTLCGRWVSIENHMGALHRDLGFVWSPNSCCPSQDRGHSKSRNHPQLCPQLLHTTVWALWDRKWFHARPVPQRPYLGLFCMPIL